MSYSLEQIVNWSPYLERVLKRFPELQDAESYSQQWAEKVLYQKVYESVALAEDDKQLLHQLRKQRNWMMGRIAIRDLSGLAELEETMGATSELADALVGSALDWHYQRFCQRYGTPLGRESGEQQKMTVIGMGKLGGHELNFSSDIDLIYTYAEGGETEGAAKSISNDQFFIRLGQALNKSLVDMTEDGFVYRVDMRLRPFGDGGPLVATFTSLEHYYEIHGRAWERYALVKARVMAGDVAEGESLFSILRPFVYRRYVDFSAMESLRELKLMIAEQVAKKGMQANIKLGAGGIREIEFIVQSYQLVHGGRDVAIQGRSLLPMLSALVEKGYIESTVGDQLREAYCFLRKAENRLQMWNDQQTHDLPTNDKQQLMLANSMGYEFYAEFNQQLQQYRDFVEQQFSAVFGHEEPVENGLVEEKMAQVWMQDEIETLLQSEDLAEEYIAVVVKGLNDLKNSRQVQTMSKEGVERLNDVMPLLLKALIYKGAKIDTFKRVMALVEAITRRSVYLVLLKENPQALKNLVDLCEVSSWLADMLVKYPALLDQLIDERDLYSPLELKPLQSEACQILETTGLDEERFMDELRQWRHAQVFKVAAADVTGNLPIMKVSDYLTWIAQAVLTVTVEFAWRLMQQKSGVPGGLNPDVLRNPFLILGYGKLGGIELGYGSDLDIVFLYEGLQSGAQTTNPGGRTLDNAIYFIRMGQKIISILSTIMPSGRLYEVDTRLRPNGNSGMLVTDFNSYQKYIINKAWNWEHQALVRARAVTGDEQSVQAFSGFRESFLHQSRDPAEVRKSVAEMRQKMRDSLDKSDDESFDLKQGAGGIVDIEFMMQYLVLAYAAQYPFLAEFTDNVRILEAVAKAELLTEEEVQALTHAYKTYRSKYHRVALANDKPLVEQSCYQQDRQQVITVWQNLMEKE